MTEEGKSFLWELQIQLNNSLPTHLILLETRAKKIFDRLVAFKDRTIERIKGIFDYLLKLPMAFFEGVKAELNIFGEGTVGTRFTSTFNDVMVGRDIEDTIAKPEISSDRADKIGALTTRVKKVVIQTLSLTSLIIEYKTKVKVVVGFYRLLVISSLVMIMINKNLQNKKTPHFCGV